MANFAEWCVKGVFKADAQKVYNEIESIGDSDNITKENVLEYAKTHTKSELHKCFEWDDTIAAEKYRLTQAGQVIRMLVIKPREEENEEKPQYRLLMKTESDVGYVPTRTIVRNQDKYKEMLNRAWAELQAFKKKYESLSELEEILALIP